MKPEVEILRAAVARKHRETKNWPLVRNDPRAWVADGYIHECRCCGQDWPCIEAQLVAALLRTEP